MAESNSYPNVIDDEGTTKLHDAAENGSVIHIHRLVRDGANLEARDAYGATPLLIAVMNEHDEAVDKLLESGADIHAQDDMGNTALHFSADVSNSKLTSRLIEAGADPNANNKIHATPLHAVAASRTQFEIGQIKIDTIDTLTKAGANINAHDDHGNTPLHYVAQGLYPEAGRVAKELIDRGADPEQVNRLGLSPLETSTQERPLPERSYSREVEEAINEHPSRALTPEANSVSYDTFSEQQAYDPSSHFDAESEAFSGFPQDPYEEPFAPLHMAASAGDHERVDQLLSQGADPNDRDVHHRTALHEAVDSRFTETVERLLAAGADPNIQDTRLGQSSLHRAVQQHHPQITQRLLDSKADPNLRDRSGDTALHNAIKNPLAEDRGEPLAMVDSLIAAGAKVDLPDHDDKCSALHLAARYNYEKVADRVIEERPDPNALDRGLNTPLHHAASQSSSMTQKMIDAGSNPNITNVNGNTPLHNAALAGKSEACSRLLDAGADPNARNHTEQTALHFAANNPTHESVERLLTAGGDPNATNEHGATPLHVAALANAEQSVDRLVKAGADLDARSPGKIDTPLETARSFNKTEAVKRLEQAHSDRKPAQPSLSSRVVKNITDRLTKLNSRTQPRNEQPNSHHNSKENRMAKEHWSNSKSARQFTEQVATRVAGQIKQGQASFQQGFDKPKGANLQPFNPATGKRFKGLNAVQLKSVAREKRYNDPRWMSYRTANRVGMAIKKGERGTRVEYLRFPPKAKAQAAQDKESPAKTAPNGAAAGDKSPQQEDQKITHHTYVVFNAEQIDRMPALETQLAKEPQQHEICERSERMVQDSNVKIETPPNGQSFSSYDKDRDTIVVPDIEEFKTPEQYYGHTVREMADRAGHQQGKDRAEPQSEAQQFSAQARHEMRREMASETISAKLHLPKLPTGDKCKEQWAETITRNPNEIRYAARDADRMADSVLKHDKPQLRLQESNSREPVASPATPERIQETQRSLQQQQQQPQRQMAQSLSR